MEVMLKLPDDLVRDATELGILDDGVIEMFIRDEVDRRVMDMVNAEIQAYRREKHDADPSRKRA